MEVKFLGTVSPYCKDEKNCPGYLVTNGKGLTDAVIAVAVREDFYNEYKEELEL